MHGGFGWKSKLFCVPADNSRLSFASKEATIRLAAFRVVLPAPFITLHLCRLPADLPILLALAEPLRPRKGSLAYIG